MQSLGALARVLGPIMAGFAYQLTGMRGPYVLGAAGMIVGAWLALRLPAVEPAATVASGSSG